MSRAQGRALNRGLRSRVTERSRVAKPSTTATLLDSYFTEYWLASQYSGSGSWLGELGVADLALPGGSANPTFCGHSTSTNPFGAGVDYVALPGTAGNYISTPDAAALDIVGDITMVAFLTADDWTPAASNRFLAKATVANQFAYRFLLTTAGTLQIGWSPTGLDAAVVLATSTVATGATDGTALYVGATLDVDNGAAGYDVKFYTSATGAAGTWSQLGTTVTGVGTTSIGATTSVLEVGQQATSGSIWAGRIARAQVYSGIRDLNAGTGGTLVADFNPSVGTFGVTETTLTGTGDGLTWTINRSTSGRRAYAITRDCWWFGTDDYLSTADNALFDFEASQDFTAGVLFRSIQDADSASHYLVNKRDTATSTQGWQLGLQGTGGTAESNLVVESADLAAVCSDATWNNPGQLQTQIGTRTAGATGTLSLYVDAVSVGGAAAEPGDTGNALVLSVGRGLTSGTGSVFYEGLIYGLGISRTGLTAAQVTTLDTELRSYA